MTVPRVAAYAAVAATASFAASVLLVYAMLPGVLNEDEAKRAWMEFHDQPVYREFMIAYQSSAEAFSAGDGDGSYVLHVKMRDFEKKNAVVLAMTRDAEGGHSFEIYCEDGDGIYVAPIEVFDYVKNPTNWTLPLAEDYVRPIGIYGTDRNGCLGPLWDW